MSKEKSLVTYLVGFKLSELESISMDNGLGARDKWREDNFPLEDLANLRMWLVLDGSSLVMMIVRKWAVRVCSSHGSSWSIFDMNWYLWILTDFLTMQPGYYGECSVDVCQTRPYSSLCCIQRKASHRAIRGHHQQRCWHHVRFCTHLWLVYQGFRVERHHSSCWGGDQKSSRARNSPRRCYLWKYELTSDSWGF